MAASLCAICLGLTLAVLLATPTSGQMGGGGQGRRGGSNHAGPNRGTPNEAPEGKGPGPEERDAIDLFSRLCVSTRGDRDRVVSIIGDGDSTVEKMDPPLLRGLENGVSGGVGWIIHMPPGEKLLVEFPPGGACIVRAPRINPAQLQGAFQNLLDQYGSSDSFKVHRLESQTKTVEAEHRPGDDQARPKEKVKYHLSLFDMTLPDTGKVAELGLATTDAKSVSIQATLSFQILPGKQP